MARKIGVMICGHGSRSQAAVDEFAVLAEKLPAYLPADWLVDYGYLEFANPVIRVGLDNLRQAGCDRILAVPGMLFAAMHAKNDIPTVLNTYAARHGIEVTYGRELGVDPRMIAAAGARIQDAVDKANAELGALPLHDTALVVIGRGASDPDANSNVAKIARMLWEGKGFGWCEVGFSGVTFPLVEPTLDHVTRLGYKRVIVFPYFLFTGILIDRIYGFTDKCAGKYPGIQFVKAGYLNDHAGVLETFAERITEQVGEVVPPTCGTCKYRTQVLGFEAEVGAVQESHHHHVEGQGAAAPGATVETCDLCDTFCTGECRLHMDHQHDHSHGHDHHHHHHAHPRVPARQSPAWPRKREAQVSDLHRGRPTREALRYERSPAEIYRQSFAAVRDEARLDRLDAGMQRLAVRLIHACGMVEVADRLAYSDGVYQAGQDALNAGAPILCDCEMVGAGIIRRYLPAENQVIVTLNDASVPELAKDIGNTRSAAAVELWRDHIDGAVVAIGNAPTALFHLLELLDQGWPKPACILGFPVGFVGAAESKAELAADPRGCEFVALRGRRGGSAMASAAVNAIAAGRPEEKG